MNTDPIVTERVVAWGSTLFCVLFSARCAATFLTKNARLFTAICLFSLSMAILLPYYSTIESSELFVAFGGFLLVFVGGLIHGEAYSNQQSSRADPLHRIALWLLVLIAVPSTITLPLNDGEALGFHQKHVETGIATIFDILGYLSIAFACSKVLPSSNFRAIIAIAVIYSIAEAIYTGFAWSIKIEAKNDQIIDAVSFWRRPTSEPLTATWLYIFSALKVIFTFWVTWCVTVHGMSNEDKSLNSGEKILKLIGAGR